MKVRLAWRCCALLRPARPSWGSSQNPVLRTRSPGPGAWGGRHRTGQGQGERHPDFYRVMVTSSLRGDSNTRVTVSLMAFDLSSSNLPVMPRDSSGSRPLPCQRLNSGLHSSGVQPENQD